VGEVEIIAGSQRPHRAFDGPSRIPRQTAIEDAMSTALALLAPSSRELEQLAASDWRQLPAHVEAGHAELAVEKAQPSFCPWSQASCRSYASRASSSAR
jgi:hypothetical protein